MIRFVAAIDNKRGLADDSGIPWQGRLPTDVRYYHKKIKGAVTIMGYGMYTELTKPLVNQTNYVASRRGTKLRSGFMLVENASDFLQSAKTDVWVLGGASLFSSTLDLANELYLTTVEADFNCTKFFPAFESAFSLTQQTEPMTENGISFRFQVWKRKVH